MRGHLAILAALAWARVGLGQGPNDMSAPAARASAAQTDVNTGVIGSRIRSASAGDTIRVPAGVYREHLRIDKPLTLIGEPGAVLDGGGRGDIVEVAAPDVTLSGFVIRNTGIDLDHENAGVRVMAPRARIENNTLDDTLFGIDLRDASDSVVRGNRVGGKDLDVARRGDGIRLWRSDRTLVEGNTIHDGRDAVLWYSKGITVRGNTAERCRYGFHLMYSDEVTLEDNEVVENSVGIYLMYSTGIEVRRNRMIRNRGPSGYGLGLKETDRFVVENNLFVGNRAGIYLDGSPFSPRIPGVFARNTIAYNDVGAVFLPAVRGNRFTLNNFVDNIEQVAVLGRGSLAGNEFWVGETGNFWTDYQGYDQNRDGVGDFVHESFTLFENLVDRHPKLRLLLFSPAQQAIEFVGRAIPAVRPEPKFIDEVPLVRPVPVDAGRPAQRPDRAGLSLVALAMGGGGLALVFVARPRGMARRRRNNGGAA
ncbi:MAG: nitrous oxide reductase family maturation protein NosD [Phycisphaerae bacterium]|nr:nitrous oxide reductase family maturation protein NosD [Phycisphaerae bacterium]